MTNPLRQYPLARYALVAAALCGLFFVYSYLALGSAHHFSSPDEMANYFFSSSLATQHTFSIPQSVVSDLAVPRAVQAFGGAFAPVSFSGMHLIYGMVAFVFGVGSLEFLTPLASVVAVVCFYFLILLVFADKRLALLSAGLLAIHPGFVYYTARGMFHNVLFVDLLIAGAFVGALAVAREHARVQRVSLYAIAGLLFGLAAIVRTSEIVWIAPLMALLLVVLRKRIDWKLGFPVAAVYIIVAFVPVLIVNSQVFKNPLAFGYTLTRTATSLTSDTSSAIHSIAGSAFFPFGINLPLVASNAWHYLVVLAWPYAIFAPIAIAELMKRIIIALKNHERIAAQPWVWYLVISACVTGYLGLYYGSWFINDNIVDTGATGLEQSYVRYFLPIYVLSIPLAARLLKRMKLPALAGWIAIFLFAGYQLAFASDVGGLAKVKPHTLEYEEIVQDVSAAIPPNALIIANASDKLLFPQFAVMHQNPQGISPRTIIEINRLLRAHTRIFVFVDQANPVDPLFLSVFKPFSLQLINKKEIAHQDAIYELINSK